jgi:hypothetical protein
MAGEIPMTDKLEALTKRLKDEQRRLIEEAVRIGGLPSSSTIQRIAALELNIAAIENTSAEAQRA